MEKRKIIDGKVWIAPGLGVMAGIAVGLILRPHSTGGTPAAAISAMQMVMASGTAGALAPRLAPDAPRRSLITCLAAATCGLIAAIGGLLPVGEIVRIAGVTCLWCTFIYGFSAVTDQPSGDDRRVPLLAVALGVILPLWPIVAAPLIGATANTVAAGPMNFILGLSPCIWLIHITQSTTGMNAIGWFHSHLLYRIVPLGQNVLMPKVVPWYWPAAVFGVSGAGLTWLSAWRRKRTAEARSDRLASAQQCR
ncbi:MAG: hypothetical protein ACP5O1_08840 [Phycisphaerae bacterium]